MIDIEKMTTDEWIDYRQAKIDALYASGKKLTPDPECSFCDTHEDYVCFYCELEQTRS
jgi:hypothetical protein